MSFQSFAQQLQFTKKETQEKIEFHYQWRDQFDVKRNLDIAFDKTQLLDAFRNFRSYQPHIAQRYIYIELLKAAQKIDPRQARINIRNQSRSIEVEVQSRRSEHLKKWRTVMAEKQQNAMSDYLYQTYYTLFQSPTSETGVNPDHVRFATESKDLLLPVAQALYEKLPEDLTGRSHANLLLSWLQTIPYNTLENRVTTNGKGYLPPPQVILNNQGDCDSKAALMASIMRLLLPEANMVMVYLPKHAMIGIGMPKQGGDVTIEVNGLSYTLLDPTGPAKFKVGEISSESLGQIRGGVFRTEKL